MTGKYLTSNEVCEMYKITKPTLWRWEKKSPYGLPFPAPALVSPGGALKRYLVDEVVAWENQCVNNRTAAI